ncbi:segregation and condensation protein A [Holzapfeliella floricola]|uniref:segregation and condensation protein A n=1 Tax=Holzapfeliella floricola TaxID=679249 RepID=UPI00070561B6|nr:segregation/condensation protein A [Holzapfeliella floricola]
MTNKLQVSLPNFEGPLDLLLHLIKVQELDIYDIPIAEITKQYLDYLEKMQQRQLEIAGEYFIMASTLLKIKSDVLLPKNDFEEQTSNDILDPRQELVDQLLTYEIYQNTAHYLANKLEKQPLVFSKEISEVPENYSKKLVDGEVKPQKLADIFSLLLKKAKAEKLTLTKIKPDQFDIKDQVNLILNHFRTTSSFSFFDFVSEIQVKSVNHVVALFLAILELSKNQKISVSQVNQNDDFLVFQKGDN